MTGPLQSPGRTGVRIAGDHYQWLVAWSACLDLLCQDREPNPAVAVGVEVDGAGNLDDVTVERAAQPHTYQQVKYAVDSATPVGTEWLTAPSASGGPCLLRKTADAWQLLGGEDGPCDVAIVTNRAPDPDDVLVAGRDARTQLLVPRAAEQTGASARGKARAAWASAAGLTEPELVRLLSVLRFDLALDLARLEQIVSLKMLAGGLRGDGAAVQAAACWVAPQVRGGRRRLDGQAVDAAVDSLGLRAGRPRTVLSVATLLPDPMAPRAAHALDWVDRFDGPDAYSKRRPKAPATWAGLAVDIAGIPDGLRGASDILVTGSLRQATAFAVGASLRMVTGADVAVAQRGVTWSSGDDYPTPQNLDPAVVDVGAGDEIAVAVQVAAELADDVATYLRDNDVPVSRLLILAPLGGHGDRSVPDSPAANALAVAVRNTVRRVAKGAPRVHLFLAAPMGLALLLGNRWNRIAPTTVYEDLGGTLGYEPAFDVSA